MYSSSGEVPSPRGIGSVSPISQKRCIYLIAEDADVELFSRFTAGTSCFHKTDDPPSQFTRIRSTHWLSPPRINA